MTMSRRLLISSIALPPVAIGVPAIAKEASSSSISVTGIATAIVPDHVSRMSYDGLRSYLHGSSTALIGSDAHLTLDGNPYTIIKQYLSEDPFLKHRVDNDAFAMIEDQYDRMAYEWVDDIGK